MPPKVTNKGRGRGRGAPQSPSPLPQPRFHPSSDVEIDSEEVMASDGGAERGQTRATSDDDDRSIVVNVARKTKEIKVVSKLAMNPEESMIE